MRALLVAMLPLFGVLWTVGYFRRQSARSLRSLGNTTLGFMALVVGCVWLFKNRRDAVSAAAVAVLCAVVVAVAGAWWLFPEHRLSITAPVVVAALCGYVAWDWQHTGGAPLGVVLAGKRAEARVRNAVRLTHDNARCVDVKRTGDGYRATVDHVGKLDAELVGQAFGSGGAQARATDRLGMSTLLLPDREEGWRLLDREVAWPGPSSTTPGAPLRFGFDPEGAPVSIPWPGSGGRHLLVGGSTGSGKSVLLRTLIAEMAYRSNVDLVLADPKLVEFRPWAARAHVARGVDETEAAFKATYTEMMRRYESLPDDDVEWSDALGPRIVLVVDEIAALNLKPGSERERMFSMLLAMGRAAGIGVVGCTQRPSAPVIPTDIRDNFRCRVGLGSESHQQSEMIMGEASERAPLHRIPESLAGAAWLRLDRQVSMCRALFIAPSDVRKIAAGTASLRGEMEWLEV